MIGGNYTLNTMETKAGSFMNIFFLEINRETNSNFNLTVLWSSDAKSLAGAASKKLVLYLKSDSKISNILSRHFIVDIGKICWN